ncbi:MAG TPA: type IV toxin-antitoxin system AbiEi family antitoxin domain-containing protein [Micromonosporaceae bacterium]|jgi:very-short-patch-repair endonuclease
MDSRRLAALARKQRGLFTRAQATACGATTYQIRRRLKIGEWRRVLGPVLAMTDVAFTSEIRDRAAALAVPGSVLAAASAARLLRIPTTDPQTYLWVGEHRPRPLPGVVFVRGRLSTRDVAVGEALRLTRPARTVVDCSLTVDERQGLRLLEQALQVGWITEDELIYRVRGRLGRRGTPGLVRLVRLTASGARSTAERHAIALLKRGRITGWSVNGRIADAVGLIGVGDVVFHAELLIVELDGWAFHATPDRFQRDRSRQNRLVAAGWTVLRFTWWDLTERPDDVIRTIRSTLLRLRARPAP